MAARSGWPAGAFARPQSYVGSGVAPATIVGCITPSLAVNIFFPFFLQDQVAVLIPKSGHMAAAQDAAVVYGAVPSRDIEVPLCTQRAWCEERVPERSVLGTVPWGFVAGCCTHPGTRAPAFGGGRARRARAGGRASLLSMRVHVMTLRCFLQAFRAHALSCFRILCLCLCLRVISVC